MTQGKNINHFFLEALPLLRLVLLCLLRSDEEEWLLGDRGGNLLLLLRL